MKLQIFVGTGGVGKTSVAAASGLNAAARGSRCLVLTIDPARRLRTALGLAAAGSEQRVPAPSLGPAGGLWAAMIDVRASLDRAVLLCGEPRQAEVVLKHPVYRILVESLAGMQELMAIERIDQALSDGFDHLIIDTAPSRHAFEFLDKPEFFAHMVSLPLTKLVGRTYRLWERSGLSRLGHRSAELYARLEAIVGTAMIRQVLDFYAVFRTIAEGYADRARRTTALLHDPSTTAFSIVTTAFKGGRDGEYFWSELNKRKFRVEGLIVNRLWPDFRQPFPADLPPSVNEVVSWYREVSSSQRKAWERIDAEFAHRIPLRIGLPELPRDVDGIGALSQLAKYLETA